jgi:hypothetical protein
MAKVERAVADAARALDVASGRVLTLDALPAAPGLYTLTAGDPCAIAGLGLDELEPAAPLTGRVLYLGKSESRLSDRLAGTHFATGESGRSTVRRTFGSLLGLAAIPRPSRIENPTRKQLMTMTANFAFAPGEDERLTAWMLANLQIRAFATRASPLGAVERAVGAVLWPPLDQERTPFWSPNPWRDPVASARERIRLAVRAANPV